MSGGPRRIALSCNNYPPEFRGGTELVVQALARHLAAGGDEVLVIAGTERPAGGREHWEERDGAVRVVRLPLLTGEEYGLDLRRPRLLARLVAALRQHRAEVLHVHHWSHLSEGQVRAARAAGLGTVVTLHDVWTCCPRFFRLPPAGIRCPTAAERDPCADCINLEYGETTAQARDRLARRDAALGDELLAAGAIVAPSADAARACREHHPWSAAPPPIEVLPHGLLDASATGLRPATAAPAWPPRLGTFGNLHREKGVILLLEAAAAAPQTALHLFGAVTDPFRAEVDARATSLGLPLHWHGPYTAEMAHPAGSLELCIFPSLCRETYGLVVDEAFAQGTPVLVSDRGALPERVAGGGGQVVPADDPVALAAAILRFTTDREAYDRLRASVPARIPTIRDAAARYREIYAEVWARAGMQLEP